MTLWFLWAVTGMLAGFIGGMTAGRMIINWLESDDGFFPSSDDKPPSPA